MRLKSGMMLYAVLAVGILGACVRGWELAYAFNPETGLYDAGAAAFVLPLISVLAALLSILAAAAHRSSAESFLSAFPIRSRASLAIIAIAGLVMVASGVLKIFGFVQSASFTALLFGILTVACGISLLVLSKARFRGEADELVSFVSTIPIYWACFMLILTFMEHPVEPVIQTFAYDLLASCAILLAIYYASAMLYGKHAVGLCLMSTLAALYFSLVAAGGRIVYFIISRETYYLMDAPFRMAVFSACFLYLLFNASSLLRIPRGKKRTDPI